MLNLTVEEKITKARTSLILDHPFFGLLVMRLAFKADQSVKCSTTNGEVILYNPTWFESLSVDEIKTVIAHEISHLALNHHGRMRDRNHKFWNKACDYVINPILKKANFVMPDNASYDSNFDGMPAESIYKIIYLDEVQNQGQQDSDNNPGIGSDPGNGSGNSGNGSDNSESFGEVQAPSQNAQKFHTPEELKQAEQDWNAQVVAASHAAKSCGKESCDLLRLVTEEILEPKANWREVLRSLVMKSAANDYSWLRPNRRYLQSGFFLPSLYSDEIGSIYCAVDTSGSIDDRELQIFMSELSNIQEELGTDMDIVACDTHIRKHQRFEKGEPVKLELRGGGGTSLIPPFEFANENNITPVCMIYWTDLWVYDDDFPKEAPPYPVFWACTVHDPRAKVPFGEIIDISDIAKEISAK
jgi:predicted metal-dependent peptidase